jgi:hypothetical protein
MYVVSVCSKCFTYFRHRHMQVFHLDVAYVSDICCKHLFKMFHLFYTYVANMFMCVVVAIHICCKHMFVNVLPVSDVCCRSDFMLQH